MGHGLDEDIIDGDLWWLLILGSHNTDGLVEVLANLHESVNLNINGEVVVRDCLLGLGQAFGDGLT